MLLRRIARPLLAGIFVYGGIAALRDPEGHAKAAQPVLDEIAVRVPVEEVPSNVTLVRVDAGVKIGAGLLFALGKAPRLSAAALAVSLVPTTAAGHRFWEIEDPERRQAEQTQFLKNLGLVGGLMLASADTEGRPSMAWRARRAGRTKGRAVTAAGQAAGQAGERLGDVAGRAGDRLTEMAGQLGDKAGPAATRVGEGTNRLLEEVDKRGTRAAKQARKVRKRAGKRTAKRLAQISKQAEKRIEKAGKQADKRAKAIRKRAAARADQLRASLPS